MDQGVSFKSYCYGIARKKALTRRKTLLLDMNLIPLEENILFPQDTLQMNTNGMKKNAFFMKLFSL